MTAAILEAASATETAYNTLSRATTFVELRLEKLGRSEFLTEPEQLLLTMLAKFLDGFSTAVIALGDGEAVDSPVICHQVYLANLILDI